MGFAHLGEFAVSSPRVDDRLAGNGFSARLNFEPAVTTTQRHKEKFHALPVRIGGLPPHVRVV